MTLDLRQFSLKLSGHLVVALIPIRKLSVFLLIYSVLDVKNIKEEILKEDYLLRTPCSTDLFYERSDEIQSYTRAYNNIFGCCTTFLLTFNNLYYHRANKKILPYAI
jgi:hypothetical protein